MFQQFIRPLMFPLLLVAALAMLAGCARQIDSGVYKASHIGETSTTYQGTIVSARPVLVEDKEYLENNTLGGLAGGGLGGLLGSAVGSGSGRTWATVGGAVAGATAGAMAEKQLKKQNAIEYIVKINDGRIMTVVQGPNPPLQVGQPVFLMKSYQGRSRIVPAG